MGQEYSDEQVLLQRAIAAARAGKKGQARKWLRQIIALNRYHEMAWLWLGGVMEDPDAQIQCLENVLVVNPENAAAQKGLAHLRAQAAKPAKETSSSRVDRPSPVPVAKLELPCPHCGEPNEPDAQFCEACGQNLTLEIQLPRSAESDATSTTKSEGKKDLPGADAAAVSVPLPRAEGAAAETATTPSADRTGLGAFVAAIVAYLGAAIPVGAGLGFAGALIARAMGYPKVEVTRFLFSTRVERLPVPPLVQFLTVTLANWISMALAGVLVARMRLGGSRKGVAFNSFIVGVGYVLLSIALQPQLGELIEMEIVNTTVSYIEFILGPFIGALAAWLAFRAPDEE